MSELGWFARITLEVKSVQFEQFGVKEAMPGSMQVAEAHLFKIKQAVQRQGFPSQKALAWDLGVARSTISNFLNGKAVTYENFVLISEKLGLDWKTIVELDLDDGQSEKEQKDNYNIDDLVQRERSRLCDKIRWQYGRTQLLDVCHLVDFYDLYVDVELQPVSSYSRLEISDLLSSSGQKGNVDRLGLSEMQQRLSVCQVVESNPYLMVIGKPGLGKTKFLQHIALACSNEKLLSDYIPILIKLRDFAGDIRKKYNFQLEDYIGSYLQGCSQEEVKRLLEEGRLLVLLDGWDEVPVREAKRVLQEIDEFVRNYYQNRVIVTYRNGLPWYKSYRFNFQELADFNSEQIDQFISNWFVATAQSLERPLLANQLIEKLKLPENQPMRALAATPILLSLICKVFSDKGEFYSKPIRLYEKCLEILLYKKDLEREIKRDWTGVELSLEQKQSLLSYLAAVKFEQHQYTLFEQSEIQGYIAKYLSISPEDTQVILNLIEAQHGLLIEQASGIYSFSNLTFQEYFAARWFVERSNWQTLINHITDKHWREIFLLVLAMLQLADELLLLMKEKIYVLAIGEEQLDQYDESNKFLLECLNSSCEVSAEVRREIEETCDRILPRDFFMFTTIRHYPSSCDCILPNGNCVCF